MVQCITTDQLMFLHLLPIFINWCIHCGNTWLLRTVFSLILHYVLIFLLDHRFLEGGATFSFNFYCYVIFSIVLYCMSFEPAIACEWMNEWIRIRKILGFGRTFFYAISRSLILPWWHRKKWQAMKWRKYARGCLVRHLMIIRWHSTPALSQICFSVDAATNVTQRTTRWEMLYYCTKTLLHLVLCSLPAIDTSTVNTVKDATHHWEA